MLFLFLTISLLFVKGEITTSSSGQDHVAKQSWGHISVREGAEMFFWAYFTKNYTSRPLILWLQGGPGASSAGIGNFLEIGPKDIYGKDRQYTWTNRSSVVFIDSPVGSGFSYVRNKTLLVATDVAAAKDLVVFLTTLYKMMTDLSRAPVYIFGECYGGKIAAEFALQLTAAIKRKEIDCNFKGLALGDPWLSPADNVQNYAKFLYANSLIDTDGFSPISSVADLIWREIESGRKENATKIFLKVMKPIVTKETNGVNFFNILEDPGKEFGKRGSPTFKYNEERQALSAADMKEKGIISDLCQYMNGPVKVQLRLPKNLTWSAQSRDVFEAIKVDFMRPGISTVEKLLNETSLKLMVYNGQLDLIVPSIGSESWVRQLKWPGTAAWMKTKRRPLLAKNNSTIGYYKSFKNLSFYWILKAGHVVPLDAPSTAYSMFCSFLFGKC